MSKLFSRKHRRPTILQTPAQGLYSSYSGASVAQVRPVLPPSLSSFSTIGANNRVVEEVLREGSFAYNEGGRHYEELRRLKTPEGLLTVECDSYNTLLLLRLRLP